MSQSQYLGHNSTKKLKSKGYINIIINSFLKLHI